MFGNYQIDVPYYILSAYKAAFQQQQYYEKIKLLQFLSQQQNRYPENLSQICQNQEDLTSPTPSLPYPSPSPDHSQETQIEIEMDVRNTSVERGFDDKSMDNLKGKNTLILFIYLSKLDESTEFSSIKRKRTDEISLTEDIQENNTNIKDILSKNYINNNNQKNNQLNNKKKEINKNQANHNKHKKSRRQKANELLEDSFLLTIGKKHIQTPLIFSQNSSRTYRLNGVNKTEKTRIISHGDDYKKTSSMREFMKYNFNFVQEEQYRTDRLITNKNNQHVDIQRDSRNGYYLIKKINENEEIPKIVWNFSKYEEMNRIDIKQCLNELEKKCKKKKVTEFSEDFGLHLLQMNNYSYTDTLRFIQSSKFQKLMKR